MILKYEKAQYCVSNALIQGQTTHVIYYFSVMYPTF